MSKTWLSYVNLSDHYERKARFLPAVLAVLPLLPLSVAFGGPLLEWIKLLGAGVGLAAVVAVAVSHIASAAGNRLQDKLFPDWPHDSPTNRWLHPDETSVSEQQKQRWYQAIKAILELDIALAVDAGEASEIRAVINDAVQGMRNRLWKAPEAERVRLHNIDYGFTRNLAGLRTVWLAFAVVSFIGCWVAYIWFAGAFLWGIVSTSIVLGAVALAVILPRYVLRKAHYYAESFFAAVVEIAESTDS